MPSNSVREAADVGTGQDSRRTAAARDFFSRRDYHVTNQFSVIRAEMVRELLKDVEGARILDLGSGAGTVSIPMLDRNRHLTLVDFSEAALQLARESVPADQQGKVSFRHSDLLSFSDPEPCDLALCLGVLAHVDSTEEVFRTLSRNLRPGGRCVVQMSDSRNALALLWSPFSFMRRLKLREMTLPDVVAAASANGLKLVSRQRHLPLVPGLARLLGPSLPAYDRWARKHGLARFGLDYLLLFEKTGAQR